MKKRVMGMLYPKEKVKKLLLMAKICMLLLLFSLQIQASVYSQQAKLSLKLEDVSVKKVFVEIEKISDFAFVYSAEDLKNLGKINVDFTNTRIETILDYCFENTSFKYVVIDNHVIVKKRATKKTQDKNKALKGKVTDTKGNPLPGVSILVKGTNIGVASDSKGDFSIVANEGDILVISFLGMKTLEYKIKDKKSIKIELEEDSEELDEVVITGYQKIEKRKLTSSVTTINGKDVVENTTLSIDQMLQGKIPGMNVMNQSSTPGVVAKIRIRGSSSISGNREPLWVLNGIVLQDPVPISPEELNSMDKVNLIGNAISSINPEDIERIDVLKDASATAIYGSKAANGVIVITTKRGKYGKPRINYSTSVTAKTKPLFEDMHRMNGYERLDLSMEMHQKGLNFTNSLPSLVGYENLLDKLWKKEISYEQYKSGIDRLAGTNTDWYDVLFRNAVSNSHNVSVSGATDKTDYYFSLGYGTNKGATKGVDMTRYNASVNINTRINKKLKFGFTLNAANSDNDRLNSSIDPYKYAYETSPLLPLYDSEGELYFYSRKKSYQGNRMPLYPLNYNIEYEKRHSGSSSTTNSMNLSGYLNYDIKSWLHFNTTMGYNVSNFSSESWADAKSYEVTEMRQFPYGLQLPEDDSFGNACNLPYGGYLESSNTKNVSYTLRFSLAANRHFGKHGISTSLGYEMNSSEYKGLSSTEYGYLPNRGKKFVGISDVDRWTQYFRNVEDNKDVVTDRVSNFMSYYATLSYSFTNKYILNFNVRGDASNKFGQDKSARFLPIWSASARWNVYEEGFLKNVKWLNSFSVRASYGIQGNVSMEHSPYLILNRGSLDDKASEYISTLDRLPNPGLRWEKTKSFNIGCDFAFFNNFIYGNFEYYRKKGEDQLIRKNISTTNGEKEVAMNGGDIRNRGWELSFSMNPINTKNCGLGISFNTSKNYNEVTNSGIKTYGYENYIDGTVIRNGYPVNSFYSYQFNGLDKEGLPTFKNLCEVDKDGNRIVNSIDEALARVFINSGQREPDLTGGFSTNMRYKRFRLNASFSFSIGAKERLNDLYDASQNFPPSQQNSSKELVNRWRQPGDEKTTNIPALYRKDMSYGSIPKYDENGNKTWSTFYVARNYWQMYNNSDIRVVSKDFLRCRNISLSYSLGNNICKKLYVRALTLGFNVSNVFVLKDSALKGRDPEQIKLGSGTIPPQRTYAFSLNVNF